MKTIRPLLLPLGLYALFVVGVLFFGNLLEADIASEQAKSSVRQVSNTTGSERLLIRQDPVPLISLGQMVLIVGGAYFTARYLYKQP